MIINVRSESLFSKHPVKVLCVALLSAFPVCVDAAVAGQIQFVHGSVRIVDAQGKDRPAAKGQNVNEGDTLFTAEDGSAQLKMIDGGMLALRPGTQLRLENYNFNGVEDGSENAVLSLLKGGLRTITGLIGNRRKEKFNIRTPNSVIGIRGTDHEPMVVLPAAPGETPIAPPGTYDKVNVGATTLTTQAGTTLVSPNQVGFAASPTQLPVLLPKLPDFYQATSTPQAKQDQKEQKQEQKTQESKQESKQESTQESTQEAAQEPKQELATIVQANETNAQAALASLQSKPLSAKDSGGNELVLSTQNGINGTLRGVAIADGWDTHFNPLFFNSQLNLNVDAIYRGNVDGDLQPLARVVDSPAGLTEFLGSARGFTKLGMSATLPSPTENQIEATIKIGSAINRDVGSVVVAGTQITWGRWEGGIVDIYSSDGQTKLGTVDNTNRNMHWFATSALDRNASFNLPLTGTAVYQLAGNTNPTDINGNVGTLSSVTMKADFAKLLVNTSINVTFNSPKNTSNWNMTANNIPLSAKDGFQSNTGMNGVNGIVHTATCTGASCGPQTLGFLDGHLLNDGQGAAMTYGMYTGTANAATATTPKSFTPGNVVSGVVVMKR